MKKICILMASHNGEKYISQQIDSIENQLHTNYELYISIDKSTDTTIDIVKEKAKKNSKIKIVSTERFFGSAAKNFFYLLKNTNIAKFTYIAFADQDDIWLRDKLSSGIDCLIKNSADGYSSDFIAFWPNGKNKYIKKSYPQKKFDYLFESPGPGCTFIFSKLLAKKVQSMIKKDTSIESNIYFHDWFVYAVARSHKFKWIISNEAKILYRQHSDNVFGVSNGFKAKLKRLNKLLNLWYLNQSYYLSISLNSLFFFKGPRLNKFNFLFNIFSLRRKFLDCLIFLVLSPFFLFRKFG